MSQNGPLVRPRTSRQNVATPLLLVTAKWVLNALILELPKHGQRDCPSERRVYHKKCVLRVLEICHAPYQFPRFVAR